MKVLSLFSGVGGFDIGLENAGMETVFQCEWDKHCRTILDRHWPIVPKWDDVSTLTGEYIFAHAPVIDVVAWGSPCQDLSITGKRAGLNGDKSTLFYEGMRIITELRKATNGKYPRISIWENVAGALSSNNGADFGQILYEMDEAGACFSEWAVLDAQHFGIPQRRRRIYLLSVFNTATANRCPNPLLPVSESLRRNETENGYFTFYTSQGKRDQYTKNICTTLKVAGIACIAGNDIAPRKLTPLESERLMGWPDNWTEGQADTHRYKQCGNGVASPVAQWIGEQLINL